MRIIFILLFVLVTFLGYSQQVISNNHLSETVSKKGWQKGYIVMKKNNDTIYGMLEEPKMKGESDKLNFYVLNKVDAKKYGSKEITAFKYNDQEFRFFDYSGWSKLIHKGTIAIYKGMVDPNNSSPFGTGDVNTVCLVFVKGRLEEKFIGRDETLLKGYIKQKAKDYFIEYIEDNPNILAEFNDKNFKFENLEDLIVDYNQCAKEKQK